jgi:UDP-N-acetylglucosamine 1-carboxyvinyltransferase
MPESFLIRGGAKLEGEIKVSGSKNAALPVLAATVLAAGPVRLRRLPDIRDVSNVIEILEGIGAKKEYSGDVLDIDSSGINSCELSPVLVRKLRGSVLLAGAMVARFGKVRMPYPGGDAIGARSIDIHLDALKTLGASVTENDDHFLTITAPNGLRGAKIVLEEMSVTATENAMLAASFADGPTIIKLAAAEPHVQDLARFLKKLGVRIFGAGTNTIIIRPSGKKPHTRKPVSHTIIPDTDEAISFAILAAATRSDIRITGVEPEYMEDGLNVMRKMGVNLEVDRDVLRVRKPTEIYRAIKKIQSGLYPKLMSDQIPPFAVLATQAHGTSLIHEWMYEGRLSNYINELAKMGANVMILDPHRAIVIGPTPLRGHEVKTIDIRTGITTIIAALVAEGESILHEAFHVDRGYANIEKRLNALGADIERIRE